MFDWSVMICDVCVTGDRGNVTVMKIRLLECDDQMTLLTHE